MILTFSSHPYFWIQKQKKTHIYVSLIDAQAAPTYKDAYERSILDPEQFWAEEAEKISWMKPWSRVLDHTNPPFTKWYWLYFSRLIVSNPWRSDSNFRLLSTFLFSFLLRSPSFCRFVGGETNACYNAVDRHVADGHGQRAALIHDSPVTSTQRSITYAELQQQVCCPRSTLSTPSPFVSLLCDCFRITNDVYPAFVVLGIHRLRNRDIRRFPLIPYTFDRFCWTILTIDDESWRNSRVDLTHTAGEEKKCNVWGWGRNVHPLPI